MGLIDEDMVGIYYNNRDLKLLLDLLACSSGVIPCFKLLCSFDKKMQKMAQVKKLNYHKESNDIIIEFDDPPSLMKDLISSVPGSCCLYYKVEIVSPSNISVRIKTLKTLLSFIQCII